MLDIPIRMIDVGRLKAHLPAGALITRSASFIKVEWDNKSVICPLDEPLTALLTLVDNVP